MAYQEEFFRVSQLPPYSLGPIAYAVRDARLAGRDIIDLSQINPDLGPPPQAIDALVQASLQKHNHRYSSSQGITRLRSAAANWYEHRFGVEVDPDKELVVTMGTKEGLTHLLLAMLAPGENVLVPTPSYPVHSSSVCIAGASFVGVPLFEDFSTASDCAYRLSDKSEDFFNRLSLAVERTWPRPKALICSFPHNPTATVVDLSFFERLVAFARAERLSIVHDFAYADVCFDEYRAPSLLEIPGAREIAVECYSLSKGFSMPGWRIGFCIGAPHLVSALKRIKGYVDFGIFQPMQIAAAKLLDDSQQAENVIQEHSALYQARRDVLCEGLQGLGWELSIPKASVFVWARLPENVRKEGSFRISQKLLDEASVAVCPGGGFDPHGDEFIRFAIVEEERLLRQAIASIRECLQ